MSIKVILWDVDGTLLDFKAQEKSALEYLFNFFNLGDFTLEMLENYHQINNKYWLLLEHGKMSKEEILVKRFEEFFDKYHINFNPNTFNEKYQNSLGETIVFCDDSYNLVKKLKGKVKQFATTNGSLIAQNKKLNKSGFIHLLDGVFISDLIGVNKPNVEFFDYVFKRIEKVSKDEIIIIGDSLNSDMQGGINAGIKTCWYNKDKQENHLNLPIDYQICSLQEILKILDI